MTLKTGEFGVASQETIHALSGLEFLERICDGRLPQAPIAEVLGFRMIEVDKGFSAFQGRPTFSVYNPTGTVHGGWYGTLLDSCMACAVQTTLDQGVEYTTVEYSVNLVRAIVEETGPIRAEGQVVHTGRRMATAEGRLMDEDGKILAHGTTTCMIMTRPEGSAA